MSFTRAAERLDISQPALSHQIRALETEIGAPLFDRLGRTIRMTAIGQSFLSHAISALRAVDAGRAEAAEIMKLGGGNLRVGAIHSFNLYLLPPVVSSFRRVAPDVHLSMLELPAPTIEAMLLEGKLDIGVAFAPPGSEEIAGYSLFAEEFVGAVDRATSAVWPSATSLAELAARPLAMLASDMATRRILDFAFAEAGRVPRPAFEANTIECLLSALVGSDLCAIVPERALSRRSEVKLIRIANSPVRMAAFLRRRGTWTSEAAHLFERLLRRHVVSAESLTPGDDDPPR